MRSVGGADKTDSPDKVVAATSAIVRVAGMGARRTPFMGSFERVGRLIQQSVAPSGSQ